MNEILKRDRTPLAIAGIALFSTLMMFGIVTLSNGLFQDWEHKTLDYRFQLRGNIPVDPRTVLIDIDDESISKIGRWPWNRSVHAEMIEILSESGAAVIGYDILFKEPSGDHGDVALAEAIEKTRNVVLPVGFELETDPASASLLTVKREIGPFPALQQVAAGIGHISSNRDSDGTIRRVPLLVNAGKHPFPAFTLSILRRFLQVSQEEIVFDPDERAIHIKNHRIPLNNHGMMLINYAGPWVETFDHYAFSDILKASETAAGREDLKAALKGKICIISNTATGYDLKPVPFESDYPGGGIHANAINTILTGAYLKQISILPAFCIAILLSCLTAGLTHQRQAWIGLLGISVLAMSYFFSSLMLFSRGGIVLPILFPVLAMTLTYPLTLLYLNRCAQLQAANEARIKDKIKRQDEAKRKRIEVLERAKKDLLKKIEDFSNAHMRKNPKLGERWEALQAEAVEKNIITHNRKMLEIFQKAKKAAQTNENIILLGETGTGKGLMARAIHEMSPRAHKPFVTVSIPSLEPSLVESALFGHVKGAFTTAIASKIGKFHLATEGTIFLDEIGEMPLQLQTKLLTVLQDGWIERVGAPQPEKVDVRVIAATNRKLEQEVQRGTFRMDLYYRLSGFTLTLPPLRKRREDIDLLASHIFLKKMEKSERSVEGISEGAMHRIRKHAWPGNIRELEQIISRGIGLAEGKLISEDDLELDSFEFPERQDIDISNGIVESIQSGEPLSDNDFLSLLRENRFEIGRTAGQLKVERLAVGSRFKGICLKALEKQDCRFEKTAEILSQGGDQSALLEEKIREYHRNLIESIQPFRDSEEAIAECRRRKKFRNIKKKYYPSIERLIKRHFDGV